MVWLLLSSTSSFRLCLRLFENRLGCFFYDICILSFAIHHSFGVVFSEMCLSNEMKWMDEANERLCVNTFGLIAPYENLDDISVHFDFGGNLHKMPTHTNHLYTCISDLKCFMQTTHLSEVDASRKTHSTDMMCSQWTNARKKCGKTKPTNFNQKWHSRTVTNSVRAHQNWSTFLGENMCFNMCHTFSSKSVNSRSYFTFFSLCPPPPPFSCPHADMYTEIKNREKIVDVRGFHFYFSHLHTNEVVRKCTALKRLHPSKVSSNGKCYSCSLPAFSHLYWELSRKNML